MKKFSKIFSTHNFAENMAYLELYIGRISGQKGSPNLKTEPQTYRTFSLSQKTEPRTYRTSKNRTSKNRTNLRTEPGSTQH